MAATNPDPLDYEQYAVQKLSEHMEAQLCADLPAALTQFLQVQCSELLKQNQAAIEEVIRRHTQRQNFFLFSLYKTTFAVPGVDILPSYQVDTLGAFNRFFTYRAVQP
ncbi:MAG TPA: DUF4359 domain-containing protein, partial [Trichocoleus sp.]